MNDQVDEVKLIHGCICEDWWGGDGMYIMTARAHKGREKHAMKVFQSGTGQI